MKKLVYLFLTLCLCFTAFAGCNTGDSGETNDNINVTLSNSGEIECTEQGGSLQLNVTVTGATDKSVIFIIDEEQEFVSVSASYMMYIEPNVPDGYAFAVTAVSRENRSKYDRKEFTVKVAGSGSQEPDTPAPPSNPDPAPIDPDDPAPKPEYLANGRIKAPTTNLLDDFSQGISPENWYIADRAWGGAHWNGCKPENVSYTADGIALLKVQGKYSTDLPMTGAVLISRETYGAGRYSVAMKVMPRLGGCNAMWTFYYANEGNTNHEIDIEMPGHRTDPGDPTVDGIGYDSVLNTNWLAESESVSVGTKTATPANDGKWHLYSFEWHTSPTPKIDYYVDGVKTCSATTVIPTIPGYFEIGCWLPYQWCGDPDFDTDYMMVDWVSYEPYEERMDAQPAPPHPGAYATDAEYPEAPVAMPVTDYVSNGTFERDANAWTKTGGATVSTSAAAKFDGSKGLSLPASASASQTITAVYGGFKYDLSAYVKGNAKIEVTFKNRAGTVLSSGTKTFVSSAQEFTKIGGEITAPAGSENMTVKILSESGTAYADNVSVRLKVA